GHHVSVHVAARGVAVLVVRAVRVVDLRRVDVGAALRPGGVLVVGVVRIGRVGGVGLRVGLAGRHVCRLPVLVLRAVGIVGVVLLGPGAAGKQAGGGERQESIHVWLSSRRGSWR